MAFRFSLAAVLKVREAVENRELYRLERIQQEIAQTLQSLQELNQERQEYTELRPQALARAVYAMDLLHLDQARQSLDSRGNALERALATLQTQRLEQLDRYQAARRGRQVLSDMFEHQRKAYQVAMDRKQQRVQDDIFLSRRNRE